MEIVFPSFEAFLFPFSIETILMEMFELVAIYMSIFTVIIWSFSLLFFLSFDLYFLLSVIGILFCILIYNLIAIRLNFIYQCKNNKRKVLLYKRKIGILGLPFLGGGFVWFYFLIEKMSLLPLIISDVVFFICIFLIYRKKIVHVLEVEFE